MERKLIESVPLANHFRLKSWVADGKVVFTINLSRGDQADVAAVDATTAQVLLEMVRIASKSRG